MRLLPNLLLCLLPCAAFGQSTPAPTPHRHSLIMEAQSVANGGTATLSGTANVQNVDAYTTDSGQPVPATITELHDQQKTDNASHVQVTVRNLSTAPDHLTLEWYFVATAVGITARQAGSKDFIFDQGSQTVDLHPGPNAPLTVSSKAIQSVVARSATIAGSADGSADVTFSNGRSVMASSVQSGVKMKGWFVRLLDDGKIVATRGSSDNLEEIAKDDTKLKSLMANPKVQP